MHDVCNFSETLVSAHNQIFQELFEAKTEHELEFAHSPLLLLKARDVSTLRCCLLGHGFLVPSRARSSEVHVFEWPDGDVDAAMMWGTWMWSFRGCIGH